MFRMKIIKIILPFIALFFISCTKRIEIELPEHQPKAVINCFFKPDEPFSVYTHKSTAITEPVSKPVKNAHISLYKDAVFIETLQFKDSLYQSEHIVEEEATYKIIADLPDLVSVTSTNYAPTAPTLISTEFLGLIATSDGIDEYQINIEIEDDVTKENYYQVVLLEEYEYIDVPDFEVDHGSSNFHHEIFSDTSFNGATPIIKVNYWVNKDYIIIKKLTLKLRAVTKEYYTYFSSIYSHIDSQQGDDIFGYIEPIDMYTNIEGGYGIFAGYSEKVEQVIFDNTK